MRKNMLLAGLLLTTITVSLSAQEKDEIPDKYLNKNQVASSVQLLPPPPEPGTVLFQYDRERYLWGKQQRETPLGAQAVLDADVSATGICRAFSEAFGIEINHENCPEIHTLMLHMREDAGDLATNEAKKYYNRVRPFVLFNDHTSVPDVEQWYVKSPSYPSGHTAMGWAEALVLAEINVENQQAILQRGYDMGTSRVIAGFHYQSDVDNARVVAAAVVARLHADKAFNKQLAKAKKEFAKLKKKGLIKFK